MRRVCAVLAATISAVAYTLVLSATPVTAATFDQVLEGARKEGRLFVLVSSPGKPETHAAVGKAFNERFGLQIRIEWTATNPVQTNSKIIAEQGGTGFVDVIGAGGNQEINALFERGLVKRYPWMETFGEKLPTLKNAVDPVIPDLAGAGLVIAHNVYGIGWNKDLIKDGEVPNTYAELLTPEWKGRFAVNAFSLNPMDYYSFDLGEEATLEMTKKTLANAPVLERGTGAVTGAISVGQTPVGISSFHQAGRVKNMGFKLFSDYIPIGVLQIYVPENAPNPNTARLFSAWFASEGMKLVNEMEPIPRIGEGSALDKMIADVTARGGKIITERSIADTNAAGAMRKKIADVMTK